MATIDVLAPVALGPADAKPLAPARRSLRGAVLGLRVDRAWQSFHWFADELAAAARADLGVAGVVVFDPDVRIGTPEIETAKVADFARGVDAAVVGLGT
jgi:hypothetical protein